MAKIIIAIGTMLSGISVIIGAFGAHKLEPYLKSIGRTETFETAVKYQFYHAISLILIGILIHLFPDAKLLHKASWLMVAGIVVFSGSLYVLCATDIAKWGAVTPIGGVLLIISWILITIAFL